MPKRRAGHVVLIGEPNVGKSTLMNSIVAAPISIVTHKAQTTRFPVRGLAIRGLTQIIFVDTPGLFAARNKFDRFMLSAAWRSLHDANIVLIMAQAQNKPNEALTNILKRWHRDSPSAATVALVINKIDLVRRENLLPIISQLTEQFDFDKVFLISASKGDGIDDLAEYLAVKLPVQDWIYPADQMAVSSLQTMATEITREKLLLRMHQEIPYQTAVQHEAWQTQKDDSVRIDQTLLVVSQSHKRMIIGPQGQNIRQIGEAARKDIEKLTDRRVHLFLQVKVKPKWADDLSQAAEPISSNPETREQ